MVEAVPRRRRVVHRQVRRKVATKSGRGTDGVLYVFADLQDVLEDGPEGRALLDELERIVNDGSSNVLIGSRVVPDYRYAGRFGSGEGWFDRGHSDGADRRDRWIRLARKFRTCVSCKELTDLSADEAPITTLGKSAASCFRQLWTESTREEQLQLYALARGGVVDARRAAALSSLVNRGLVRPDPETGVVGLRSEALREFIEHDVDRRELDAWRREGGGGVWRFIWPPLAIGGALGLAFLAMSNPEMRTTLLATLLGLLPAALPLLGGGRGGTTSGGAV